MLKFLVFAAAVSVALARPVCRNPEEFGRGFSVQGSVFHYWECVAVGEAVLRECPSFTEFNEEHLRCLTPGAPIPPDENPPLKCDDGFAVDLSVDPPVCTELRCAQDQIVVHPPTGVPECFTVVCPEGHAPTHNGVCEPIPNTQCPGASAASHQPSGFESCQVPACTGGDLGASRHFASSDPTKFYQCKGEGTSILVDCPPNLCFDVTWQVCVFPHDWKNPCAASL